MLITTKKSANPSFHRICAKSRADPDHSEGEKRWLTFGISTQGNLLAISHIDEDQNIRIISTRLGTKPERKLYEEG